MKSKSVVFSIIFLFIGLSTLYLGGPAAESLSLSSSSATAAEQALRMHQLKEELQQAGREQQSAQVSYWKAQAEILALQTLAMDLQTLAAIYRRLSSFEIGDKNLKARIQGSLSRAEQLNTLGGKTAVKDLGEVLTKLAQNTDRQMRDSYFGELEVFEIYFYRSYKRQPTRNLEALFWAGKAGTARYFQGLDYLEEYILNCEKASAQCAHLEEAKALRSSHVHLIEQFESEPGSN